MCVLLKISKIKSQSLSSLTCDHRVCRTCHIVDRNYERSRTGFPCPFCGTSSRIGLLYFHLQIHTLINLIQEAFHASPNKNLFTTQSEGRTAQSISVIIFYCTLREALLENLIVELCSARNIPKDIFDRLMSDNRTHIQKQNKLFPSLTGKKWKEAIKKANKENGKDYEELDDFVASTVEMRNQFVHRGNKFSINPITAEKCLENIPLLISFYVDLHNIYVHPIYMGTLKTKPSD